MRTRRIQQVALFILRYSLGIFLRWWLRVRIEDPQGIGRAREPLLIVSNHLSVWDPFLVGLAFYRPVHYLAADGNFRSRVMRALLSILVEAVPKAKARTDMEAIRHMRALIEARRAVALFPEGQRSWDGAPRALLPGVEKLSRLLRARVVAVTLVGAYYANPRWGRGTRRGGITIRVAEVCSAAEARAWRGDLLFEKINTAVHHDENEWQHLTHRAYPHRRRAEYLERALFLCPQCGTYGALRSAGARLDCTQCGAQVTMDRYGTLHGGRFDTVRDWNRHQLATLGARVAAANPTELLAWLRDIKLWRGFRSRPLRFALTGRLEVRLNGLVIVDHSGAVVWAVPLSALSAINVQLAQNLEFYAHGALWVARPQSPRESSYWVEQTLLAALY